MVDDGVDLDSAVRKDRHRISRRLAVVVAVDQPSEAVLQARRQYAVDWSWTGFESENGFWGVSVTVFLADW